VRTLHLEGVVSAVTPGRAAFWRAYLVTMRPYLLFVSGITGLAGLALAPPVPLLDTVVLALIFFLSYGFGQALTDCFQTDTDALSAPYRPLVRGVIHPRDVFVVSLIGLLLCGLVLAFYCLATLPLALLATVGLATYTHFKRRWWGGPWYNAWIVAVLALIGYLSGLGAAGTTPSWSLAGTATIAAVFFGYANFVLVGYFKDVSADRATGYHTLPVAQGLRLSARVSDLLALFAVVAALTAVAPILTEERRSLEVAAGAGVLLAAIGATVLGQLRLHAVSDEAMAHRAIVPVVHAYILLLSAICVAHRPEWLAALVLFYGMFVFVMVRRPMVQQV
jgi:4-hydroxybenzoate polyprenyltransferase